MTNKELKAIICAEENEQFLTPKGKLFKRLPMRYWNKVDTFTAEDGLIDDCRFILRFVDGCWLWGMESVPVRSITEAIEYIKEAAWH